MTYLLAPAYGAGGTGGGGGGGGGGASFTVDADFSTVSGAGADWSSIPVRTFTCTVTPDGGTAPFTYAWEAIDDSSGTWTIESASANATRFTCANVIAGDPAVSATYRCLVTDALGASAYSSTITATVQNFGGWGPAP